MSPLFCVNCREPMYLPMTENGRCPTCGLLMVKMDESDYIAHKRRRNALPDMEFDLMLTALLYGKKP